MKCPHCEEEIPGTPCPSCGENVYDADANYCSACGKPLKESVPPVFRDDDFLDDEEDIDFDSRELCPDGTCTGIIVDGRCSECGKAPGDGDIAKPEAEEAVSEAQSGVSESADTVKEKDA